MKRFLTKLFLFLLPVIGAFIYVEWRLSTIPNNFVLKEKYLLQRRNSIEILALGNSHILEGINPQYFSRPGYNLGNHGQSLYYDIRIAEQFLDSLTRLKLVLISIDHFSLDYQVYKSELYDLDYYYYKYYGINYKDMPAWDFRKYSFITMHSFGWTTREIRSNFRPYDAILVDTNGFVRMDSAGHLTQISDTLGSRKAAFYSRLTKFGKRDFILGDLQAFIELLQKRHIQVAIITTPVLPTLANYVDKKMYAGMVSAIHELCNKYHLEYGNYFYDPRFTIDDFNDNDHLNFAGAEKFTRIVDSEIVRPILH